MGSIWRFLVTNWSCISIVGLLGYFIGAVTTRHIMAPAFCPECMQRNAWLKDLKRASKSVSLEEKDQSRRFYWLRRKSKKPPDETP